MSLVYLVKHDSPHGLILGGKWDICTAVMRIYAVKKDDGRVTMNGYINRRHYDRY